MSSLALAGAEPRRLVRTLGLLLVVSGTAIVLWGVLVWLWQDPFTALYTRYEQHRLAQTYERRVREFRLPVLQLPARARPRPEVERRIVRGAARRYRLDSHEGDALGRIVVPRLGLRMVFVDGTSPSTLQLGPGRDLRTLLPGEGGLVYIAGHRTTYLAPFSHIDSLRRGDRITLQLPYGTFVYRVTGHVIVPSGDLSVLRPRNHEVLALQACNPRFFATQRYIVYALPASA